jgi:hypothetical protein
MKNVSVKRLIMKIIIKAIKLTVPLFFIYKKPTKVERNAKNIWAPIRRN